MALLGLLLGKFVVYGALFFWAPRLLQVAPKDPFRFALSWATVRLALGLLAIVPAYAMAFALSKAGMPGWVAFYTSLFGIRASIWAGMAAIICRRHAPGRPIPWTGWVALGVLVNFVIDLLANASGADDFKFFC